MPCYTEITNEPELNHGTNEREICIITNCNFKDCSFSVANVKKIYVRLFFCKKSELILKERPLLLFQLKNTRRAIPVREV